MNRSEAIKEFRDELPYICKEKFTELSFAIREINQVINRYQEICDKVDNIEGFKYHRILQLWFLKRQKDKLLSELNRFFYLNKTMDMPESGLKMTIEAFKVAHPMIDTAKEYLEVKYNKAKCPFHNDKTASFFIYEDHCHCYGCQFHSDVIGFLMKIKNVALNELLNNKK